MCSIATRRTGYITEAQVRSPHGQFATSATLAPRSDRTNARTGRPDGAVRVLLQQCRERAFEPMKRSTRSFR